MEVTFSKNLKKYLETNKMSLKELGQKLEVPTSTVHGWLNGIPPRNILTIKKIASLLCCSMDELCFEEKKDSPQKSPHFESNLTISFGDDKYHVVLMKIKE
jgi:putative transcriptional regulator